MSCSRRMASVRPSIVVIALLFVSAAAPLMANRPYAVDDRIAESLQQDTKPDVKLTLQGMPVINGERATLELERFEVWAPDARIVVHEADGKHTHTLPRPETRFYKGHVAGDPDSAVEISVAPNGRIEGSIFTHDRVVTIARGVRVGGGVRPRGDDHQLPVDRAAPLLVSEFDPVDDLITTPDAGKWHCDSEEIGLSGIHAAIVEA